MRTTLALSWKALVSKIHPPLSMSPRDSQKLLGLLNASFQRHLDAEHPTGLEGKGHYARSHIQSILGSPLFGSKLLRRRGSRVNQLRDEGISLGGMQYWMKEPLRAFQKSVSNGTASLETAKLCLEMHWKNCLTFATSTTEVTIDTGGAGSAILNWLWSSGMERSGEYLHDLRLIRLLTIFLVIEQRYDVIYNWFHRLQNRVTQSGTENQKQNQMAQAHLLLQLVKSESEDGAGLGAAMVHFEQYFDRIPKEHLRERAMTFRPAGTFLSFALTDPGKADTIPKEIFQPFVDATKGWANGSMSLAHAIQHVYRPENPQPGVALHFLQELRAEKLEKFGASARHRLILMSLKTAELLLASDQRSEATWVMRFLQTNYGEEVGSLSDATPQSSPTTKTTLPQEEQTNLRLLESLAVP